MQQTHETEQGPDAGKVQLEFMVVPEELAALAYVPNPVKIRIVNPRLIFLRGILGESGRKLVEAGISFYFEEELAEELIAAGIAEEVPNESATSSGGR